MSRTRGQNRENINLAFETKAKKIIVQHLRAIVREVSFMTMRTIDDYENIYSNAFTDKLYDGVKILLMEIKE